MFNKIPIIAGLGIIENMAYFTTKRVAQKNKYYIKFGKEGAKHLSEDLKVPFW